MMRLLLLAGLLLAVLYLASGVYIVSGNEVAAVRRFGRLDPQLRTSGPHFDWPWPFVAVDRLALNQARTVTIGTQRFDGSGRAELALPQALLGSGGMLTGDKNILSVTAQVHYRLDVNGVRNALYQSVDTDQRLAMVAESILADLVARSGVDYVHTIGLQSLAERMAADLDQVAVEQNWGIEIDHVAIDQVSPPVEVKADFLDVANARADRSKMVNEATAYAEQKLSEASAERSRIFDEARQAAQARRESARGRADRFAVLLERLRSTSREDGVDYAEARRWMMERQFQATWREIVTEVRPVIISGDNRYQLSIETPAAADSR